VESVVNSLAAADQMFADKRDGDARQHGVAAIGDDADDGSRLNLRMCGDRRNHPKQDRTTRHEWTAYSCSLAYPDQVGGRTIAVEATSVNNRRTARRGIRGSSSGD
jgi:hypothetical protein